MTTLDQKVYTQIIDAIAPFRKEIATRNDYIQRRDDFIYGTALEDSLTFPGGADKTLYNWLERVVDVQVSQLFGREFRVYSSYMKTDLSSAADIADQQQEQNDKMLNKRAKANADVRNEFVNAIIRDNGGHELFQMGGQSGSAYGYTAYKSWLGDEEKAKKGDDIPWHIEMIENVQNFYALWSSDNFRKAYAYVYDYEIDVNEAKRIYGQYLLDGEEFQTIPLGTPTSTQTPAAPTAEEGLQPMVRILCYTGKLTGICGGDNPDADSESLYECQPGEETEIDIMVVGGKVVRVETRADFIPRHYIIPNIRLMRRPWGKADVNDTCIEINRTYLQRMSRWFMLQDKTLFAKYLGKNYDHATVPRPTENEIQIFPADADQDITLINTPQQFEEAYPKIIQELKENFVRAARMSRVLFDDPTVNADSNQALMTTMKPTVDAVEKKQKIWGFVLVEMFEDALRTLANRKYKGITGAVEPDGDWFLYVKFPSVLRTEDQSFQTMLINEFNTGAMSVDTFLERQGYEDPGEELDRIRDNMSDKVASAIMGKRLATIAEFTNAPPFDPSLAIPQVKHTVQWRAALTPQQEANLASEMGWQNGPFGSSMGPQGNEGNQANENQNNEGFVTAPPGLGGLPIERDPLGNPMTPPPTVAAKGKGKKGKGKAPAAAPVQQVPAENQPGQGPVSQPGSGQPAPTTPAGAVAQASQQNGA